MSKKQIKARIDAINHHLHRYVYYMKESQIKKLVDEIDKLKAMKNDN